jgi:hypothetical protein
VGTVSHPSNNALQATDGTFTGALSAKGGAVFNEDSADVDFRVESNDNTHGIFLDAGAGLVGIGNSNPDGHYNLADDLVIGNGSGGRGLTIYSGNDSSGYIGFNDVEQDSMRAYIQYGHNDDTMTLASSAGASLKIDSLGHITKPLQPAFMAKLSSNQTNINNNSAHQDIQFANEIFDQNADFNTSNYTFTAPVTGRYQLNVQVYLEQVDTAMDFFYVTLLCSNNSAFFILDPNFSADLSYYHVGGSVLMDMDAGDTAKITYVQAAGTAQTDVNTNSYFSGFLAC